MSRPRLALRGRVGLALCAILGVTAAGATGWVLLRHDLPSAADRLRLSELGDPLGSQVTFEVAVSRMPLLADTAPLYRVVRKNMTEGHAARLAARFGIPGGVTHVGGKWADCLFTASDGDLSLHVYTEPGCMKFADQLRWGGNAPAPIPPEEEAVKLSRAYLKKVGLMPEGDVFVSFVGVRSTRGHRSSDEGKLVTDPTGWGVTFRRRLSGIEVSGKGGLSVEFAAHNEPAFVSKVWRPVEKDRDVPLIGVAAALDELREGRAGFKWLDRPGTARIESVELVYWERPVVKRQMFFEPVYEFKGTFTPDAGAPAEAFKAYVPALGKAQEGDSED